MHAPWIVLSDGGLQIPIWRIIWRQVYKRNEGKERETGSRGIRAGKEKKTQRRPQNEHGLQS